MLTVVDVPEIVKLPLTVTFPVTANVEPSNVRLDSTVAFGAEPSKVITPLLVVPVKLKSPLEPDVPADPLDPDVPDDPLVPPDPDEPDVPADPEEPDVPEDPDDPLVPEGPATLKLTKHRSLLVKLASDITLDIVIVHQPVLSVVALNSYV